MFSLCVWTSIVACTFLPFNDVYFCVCLCLHSVPEHDEVGALHLRFSSLLLLMLHMPAVFLCNFFNLMRSTTTRTCDTVMLHLYLATKFQPRCFTHIFCLPIVCTPALGIFWWVNYFFSFHVEFSECLSLVFWILNHFVPGARTCCVTTSNFPDSVPQQDDACTSFHRPLVWKESW